MDDSVQRRPTCAGRRGKVLGTLAWPWDGSNAPEDASDRFRLECAPCVVRCVLGVGRRGPEASVTPMQSFSPWSDSRTRIDFTVDHAAANMLPPYSFDSMRWQSAEFGGVERKNFG